MSSSFQFNDHDDIPDEDANVNSPVNAREFVELHCKNNLVHNKGGIKPHDLLYFMSDLNSKKNKHTPFKKDRANSYAEPSAEAALIGEMPSKLEYNSNNSCNLSQSIKAN